MNKILSFAYRLLKFLFVLTALSAVTAYFAYYVLINHYFSKKEIKSIVTGQFQEALNRPVVIKSASFDIYGKIYIRDLTVYSKDLKKDFINCALLTGKFSPSSIVSGRIQIEKLKLISPTINLRKDEKGNWRFADILEKYRKKEKSGSTVIENLEIEDGTISIEDLKNSLSHSFNDINFTADLTKKESSDFTIATNFTSDYIKSNQPARFFLSGKLNYDKDLLSSSVDNINAQLTIDDKIFSAEGKIENLSNPSAQIAIEIPEFNLKKITDIKDEISMPQSTLKVFFSKDISDNSYNLKFFSDKLKATANAKLEFEGKKAYYEVSCLINNLQAEKIRKTLSPFIKNPSGFLNISLKASAKENLTKKWEIKSDFENMSFTDTQNIMAFKNVKGKIIINEKFKAINVFSGESTIKKHRFKWSSFLWEKEKSVENFKTVFYFNDKKVKTSGIIKNNETSNRTLKVYMDSSETDLDEINSLVNDILEKKKGKKPSKGHYDFLNKKIDFYYTSRKIENKYGNASDITAQANLSFFSPDFQKLSGEFKIKLLNGSFIEIDKNSEENNLYHLISLPITTIYRLNRAGALKSDSKIKNVKFSQTAADYTLNNGKIVLNSFYIDGSDFMAYTKGDIDFTENKLNLNVYTISNKYSSMGGLPEALTDEKGRPALAFRIKGKFRNNEIKILDPNYNVQTIKKAINDGINFNLKQFVF